MAAANRSAARLRPAWRVVHGDDRRRRRCGRRLLHRLRQARALGCRPAHPATTVRRSDAAASRGRFGDDVPAGVGTDGDRIAGLGADRPSTPRGPFGGGLLRRDDPTGVRHDPAGPDGARSGGRGGPIRRHGSGIRAYPHRGLRSHRCWLWVEGGTVAVARVAAAGTPRGAEPRLRIDERRHGQSRRVRHRPYRSAIARAGPTLVGRDSARHRRRLGGVWRSAGVGGHGSQTAACLFDDREHGADRTGPWRGDAPLGNG